MISEALNKLNLGVAVVGTKNGDSYNLMTAAWLTQVSSHPYRVALAVGSSHLTASLIERERTFSLSLLADDQESIARTCGFSSGRKVDKSTLVPYDLDAQGLPFVVNCAARLDCKLEKSVDLCDHMLFIAEITDAQAFDRNPLPYIARVYFPG